MKPPLSLSSTLAATTTKGFWASANDNDKQFFFLVLGIDRVEVESHYSCWVKKWNIFPLPLVQVPSLTTKQPTLKVSVANCIRTTLTIHSKTISITMMFTKHWMKLLSIYVNIVGNFMGCCDNHNSSERWSLLGSIPNEHVSPSNYKGFWMSTPKTNKFLLQCANMVWGTKATRSPTLSVLRTFYKQRVSLALQFRKYLF